jgi:hypothetical protein
MSWRCGHCQLRPSLSNHAHIMCTCTSIDQCKIRNADSFHRESLTLLFASERMRHAQASVFSVYKTRRQLDGHHQTWVKPWQFCPPLTKTCYPGISSLAQLADRANAARSDQESSRCPNCSSIFPCPCAPDAQLAGDPHLQHSRELAHWKRCRASPRSSPGTLTFNIV